MPAADKLGRRIAAAVAGKTGVAPLLAARRKMVDAPYRRVFKGEELPNGGWVPTMTSVYANPVARDGTGLLFEDEAFLRGLTNRYLEDRPEVHGFYMPEYNLVSYPAKYSASGPDARKVRRHELMHAYTEAARQGQPGMPIASRLVASIPGDLSRPFDEILATRADGRPILDVPWDYYASHYARDGATQAARVARALHAAQVARDAAKDAGRLAAENPVQTAAAIGTTGGVLYGLSKNAAGAAVEDE